MKNIQIVGVPEHFNLPWHLAIEEGAFEERGIDLQWTDVPEGTGKMCTMLREGKTDIAVILTEGIVKDIVAGNPSKIVQVFVQSPLYWGIHVGKTSVHNTLEDLKGKKAAISRYGSGSHLMAYINADNNGWSYNDLQFEVINNLQGAIDALTNGTADYFMWEHFTTKPIVDKGIFRRISDCPTPWPCFVIAVRDEVLKKSPAIVKHVLEVINVYTSDFKDIPSIDRMLANRYKQKVQDIQEWLSITRWSQENIAPITVKNIQEQLVKLNIIEKSVPYSEIVTKL
ncbi:MULTISPECIES: substrate-binding domain-containing protein [Galbibacter]|uniref:Substrate-binding domain-containing protein n=1 Tax=Galbibacter pacificus TaxID=2996052 RepID=A0ABT6FQV3_9FLAO|nr:substrate-binding domain-containing protein [Galbibacter pacificus]MDG3581883.1 substrate-binding domain-containing protein [Galbibacter pacificus]MDG3585643.1 substrate-binding domain-containing protein [Galbibacter pacificus]